MNHSLTLIGHVYECFERLAHVSKHKTEQDSKDDRIILKLSNRYQYNSSNSINIITDVIYHTLNPTLR